ncbi:MAG: hypothetical protein LC745_02785, partial [Planctomycetia bacterium]|nr:hypothetical protein [Planctomycetia bacterium]
GDALRFRVVAESLGSWLDAVVTVRDHRGKPLAQNDDATGGLRQVAPSLDSVTDTWAGSDEDLVVEVTDRFDQGGPAYSYRLSAGPVRPDFLLSVVTSSRFDPAPGRGTAAYLLNPGASLEVPFAVIAEGRTGPITVRAEGLPQGVSAAPVTVRPQSPRIQAGTRAGPAPATSVEGVLALRADSGTGPISGRFRVVASAAPAEGPGLTRCGSALLRIDSAPDTSPARPVLRRVREFPIRVSAPVGVGEILDGMEKQGEIRRSR